MTRAEAIRVILQLVTDELVVVCNGYPSREAYAIRDRQEHFYMIGSMGLASAIGLGVALSSPHRRVLVLDGDGNVFMNMGTLGTIAAHKPKNLLHVVLDNEVYGSTGDQATISREVPLDAVARASGYVSVGRVHGEHELRRQGTIMLAGEGPGFLLVKVSKHVEAVPRVSLEPMEITARFMHSVGNSGA